MARISKFARTVPEGTGTSILGPGNRTVWTFAVCVQYVGAVQVDIREMAAPSARATLPASTGWSICARAVGKSSNNGNTKDWASSLCTT